jgi:hypothetical protein
MGEEECPSSGREQARFEERFTRNKEKEGREVRTEK